MRFKLAVILLAAITGIVSAQQILEQAAFSSGLYGFVQDKYGLDYELINGIQFYDLYHLVKYHPFYLEEEWLPGSVTISGKQFECLLINYDIYNQWVVLEYNELMGGTNKIILDPLSTDCFVIDGNYFQKKSLDDNGLMFYQVIRVKELSCYIHWKKKQVSNSTDIEYAKRFSDPLRRYFLEYDGQVYPFSNRRNFASIFTGDVEGEVRVYLRKNNIRFRNISMGDLTGLMKHVSSVIN